MAAAPRIHEFPEGRLVIEDAPPDGRAVRIELAAPGAFCPDPRCVTAYPDELILVVARTKGLAWTCDEILRDEAPDRVAHALRTTILRYVDEPALAGKRLLDFGSGSGASTINMARMFPDTAFVGVELDPRLLALARARQAFYRELQVSFRQAEKGDRLPEGLGRFDFIMLNAVYEHLLPEERRALLPAFWRLLNPGGILFVSETPYRWSVMEWHTTGLPLLNYLTDREAHLYACLFSRRVRLFESWRSLLKNGIRGCDPDELLDLIRAEDPAAEQLAPTRLGYWRALDDWPVKDEEVFADFTARGLRLRRFVEHIRKRVAERRDDPRPIKPQPMAAYTSLALRKSAAAGG